MRRLRDISIRTKLNLLVTLTAGIALALACAMFVTNDTRATKASLVQHLSTVADVVGGNCIAALTFDDPKAANDVLASLRFEPTIHFACVYDRRGQTFATYQTDGQFIPPPLEAVAAAGHLLESDGKLQIVAHVRYDDNEIGTGVVHSCIAQIGAHLTL